MPGQASRARFSLRALAIAVVTLLGGATSAHAQFPRHQTGCYDDKVQINPNRPTVANPADITQYGVLELEYGWDHGWPATGQRFSDAGGLVKFGLLCDVEIRWTTTSFLSQTDSSGTQRGFGDNWIGPQVRFVHQSAHVPTIAASYAVKIPSASTAKALGSGRVDHQFTLLASKDAPLGVHIDANASLFLIGRADASGFDENAQFNFAFSHTLYKTLQVQGELYGNTQLNAETPGYASGLAALVWFVTPRLEIDAGMDTGMTQFAPRRRIFAGFTYSIGNFYRLVKGNAAAAPQKP
jgi:hypothetical protein